MNVILQTRSRVISREVNGAGRNQKVFVDQVDQAISEASREVRSKINRAIFLQATSDINARVFFESGILNIRIGFVVAKKDVKFRLVLLDKIVFQRQRFFYVVDDDVVDVNNLAHQRAGLGVLYAFVKKVRAHAIAQGLGFSDV